MIMIFNGKTTGIECYIVREKTLMKILLLVLEMSD